MILLILCNSYLHSQEYFSFGDNSTKLYAGIPSAPIKIRATPKFTYRFASKVGGVSFEQTLTSSMKISIDYIEDNPDDYRLEVIANGIRYNPNIADWQLIPITKFANTDHVAAVSLFGPNGNEYLFDIVYHEAFQNTLLGLRLLQADMMLLNIDEFHKLPMYENKYTILGKSENNDYKVDEEILAAVSQLMYTLQVEMMYDSWIYSDKNQLITTESGFQDLLSGDKPNYYFWKAKIKDENSYTNSIDSLDISFTKKASTKLSKYKVVNNEFIGDTIMIGNSAYHYNASSMQLIEKISRNYEDELKKITDNNSIIIDCVEVNELFKSSVYQLLEKINPMVYKAADNTMKFSALFRYIKRNNPENWAKFITKIENVEISPKIKTPTSLPKG
ncbi:hypothetical protein [Psychroserpens sp.]